MKSCSEPMPTRRATMWFRRRFATAALVVLLPALCVSRCLAQAGILGWGSNPSGVLGAAPATSASINLPMPSSASVAAVSAGATFSMALLSNGTVWSWGAGGAGQLGNGARNSSSSPVQVSGLTNVTAIAAGGSFGLALTSNRTVRSWGYDIDGELGNGSDLGSAAPAVVPGLTGVVAIAAGSDVSLALKSDGTVWAWGDNTFGELGHAMGAAGDIVSAYGVAPLNWNSYYNPVPLQVAGLANIKAIAAGTQYSMALAGDGTVWFWGNSNLTGSKFGRNPYPQSMFANPAPAQVTGLSDVTAIAAGGDFRLVLESDGTVWAWGENDQGELGHPPGATVDSGLLNAMKPFCYFADTPTQVSGLTGVEAIAGGADFGSAVLSDGTVWSWGDNAAGQIGHAAGAAGDAVYTIGFTQSNLCNPRPNRVFGLSGASIVSAGANFNLAIGFHANTFYYQNPVTSQLAYSDLQFTNGVSTVVANALLPGSTPSAWRLAAVADMNNDGAPDLVWQNSSTGEVYVSYIGYRYGAPAVTGGCAIISAIDEEWRLSGVTDLNGDGYPDLVWRNTSTGDVYWLPMTLVKGVPTTMTAGGGYVAHGIPLNWTLISASNLIANTPCLLWRDTAGDVCYWTLVFASGAVSERGSYTLATTVSMQWIPIGTADINGDGQPDLLWQDTATGQIGWWQLALNGPNVLHEVAPHIDTPTPAAHWMFTGAF